MAADIKQKIGLFLFILAAFCGSFLLFSIQPLIAKAVLPQLGGVPSVWNISMMTYQILLVGGYAYAWGLQRAGKRQTLFQVVLVLGALVCLPVGIGALDLSETHPGAGLVMVLLSAVGLPFFLLASMSPLIQVWYTRFKAYQGNPYFLYAVSNAGSLAALLIYPFMIEPFLPLAGQNMLWSFLFGIYCVVLLVCLFLSRKGIQADSRPVSGEKIPLSRIGYWMVLAFVPSSLMLGVTTYITVDISPVPLFWIVPLALYLMSYIFAFSKWNKNVLSAALAAQPAAVILFLAMFILSFFPQRLIIPHLAVFFVMCQVCHSVLAQNKPGSSRLTLFYLCIAAGGALGGIFNALIAPLVFNDYFEYIIVFLLGMFLRPGLVVSRRSMQDIWRDFAYPLSVFFIAFGLFAGAHLLGMFNQTVAEVTVLLMVGGLMTATSAYPLRYALTGAVLVFFGSYVFSPQNPYSVFHSKLIQERSFFGVSRVVRQETSFGRQTVLYHGKTIHGMQYADPVLRRIPQTYYAPDSGAGAVFKTFAKESENWRIGVVGLGTGAMSAYGSVKQDWTYFEIDPGIIKLSRGMVPVFSYVRDFTPSADIRTGDGRVSLAKEQKPFNLIVLDAFSSDAVPTHLMTREAVQMYLKHLTPDGILLFHISNRVLDFDLVLSAIAEKEGLYGAKYISPNPSDGSNVSWVVLSSSAERIHELEQADKRWQALPEPQEKYMWTDDYVNLLGVMRRGVRRFSQAREEMKKLDF